MGARIVAVALMMMLWVGLAGESGAVSVHYFDCKECHLAGLSLTKLGSGNACLNCHGSPPSITIDNKGDILLPSGGFSIGDASNAMGSNPVSNYQSSHMWAAPTDNVPQAGAETPSRVLHPEFYTQYGVSEGKVTCSRCHNPHEETTNPKLLVKGPGSADNMCLACHSRWDQDNNRGQLTHPLISDYEAVATAQPEKYRPALMNVGYAGISLVDGGISCTSCHWVHFTDSDSSTQDGPGQSLSQSSGKLLKADGPQAVDKSALCQSCHIYSAHGDGIGEQVGCLGCHSGHVYDPQSPNYYVLRKTATTATFGTVNDLDYSSTDVLDPVQKVTYWNDGMDGLAQGYCEKCHGDARDIGFGAGDYHVAAAVCTDCHSHSGENGFSFSANCNACHTYPPAWGSHQVHISSTKMPEQLGCNSCHLTADHQNGLSEVGFNGSEPWVAGGAYSDPDQTTRYTVESGYAAGPAYVGCDNFYCHSNAAPFDGLNSYRQPVWGGATADCAFCHGDSSAPGDLSGNHAAHVEATTYAFDCSRCHAATVSDSSTISDRDQHIDREKDVSLSGPGSYDNVTRGCSNTYCHSDAVGGAPRQAVKWGDSGPLACDACHNGRIGDGFQMESNAHKRLANDAWIRQYQCEYCHDATVDDSGAIEGFNMHVNEDVDVTFDPKWAIPGKPAPSYDPATMVCDNIYCHSDGTTGDPEVREFPWDQNQHAGCDSCHGHMENDDCTSCHGAIVPQWQPEDQWKRAMPMYTNEGPGTARANSHLRHLETEFSCENCHFTTVVGACGTTDCHDGGIPDGTMTEVGHVNANVHVNKIKDVVFKDGGTYDPVTKKCSNTSCHTGDDPQWGDTRNGDILCLTCHGTTEADVNDFDAFNGVQGRINMTEWMETGHGRPLASGDYPSSGNPPSNFPGNPCWYCHDNEVLHKDDTNPLRLKIHPQFQARFTKECVYCHMEGQDNECLACHNDVESLSPQLTELTSPTYSVDHSGYVDGLTGCLTSGCHLPMEESQCLTCHKDNGDPAATQLVPDKVYVGQPDPPYSLDHYSFTDGLTNCLSTSCHTADAHIHNTGAGFWSTEQKAVVENQYLMMGVCLQCHDDDSNGQCTECHTGSQYVLGYDPGTGFISGNSKITGFHFGFKHEERHKATGEWPGGMFCWDCHDPHGDDNIYMVQKEVATTNDGKFGTPETTGEVKFTKAMSGLDYAKNSPPFDGICNVCHMEVGQHYRYDYGDGHQSGRVCTSCHNHSFSDGHASGETCNSCHGEKPIPRHTAFSQPRDCTKCHEGVILKRMDIMRQFRSQSHHVQGVEVDNTHCYSCHWEATELGLINLDYHEGFNYKTNETQPNAKNDLVVWQPEQRPERYELGTTAVVFTASKIGTAEERSEVAKVTTHCVGCHSDQNNDTDVFGDCKTPRQYAWDLSSINARYSDTGTANWGKYSGTNIADKSQQKAFSAHGNAVANRGGWSATSGEDGTLPNTRNGTQNVQCYDCHSSHGSNTSGVTTSYATFDGTYSGGNLKEAQAGKGGYGITYRAGTDTDGVNPMNPGASQCFDCHENADAAAGNMPWGYQSTFGASAPIISYRDSARFGGGTTGHKNRFAYRAGKNTMGGHLKASAPLQTPAEGAINGLCTPCHDPHGLSPSLGGDRAYAVPLLKGTWMTSPYKDDIAQPLASTYRTYNRSNLVQIDRRTFGNTTTRISEDAEQFSGLCLRCHPKDSLTDGANKNTAFKSVDRIHETVSGWGNNAEHSFPCAKCHNAHSSGLGRLMRTNCLDVTHKGQQVSGGAPYKYGSYGKYPTMYQTTWPACHETQTGVWDNQRWNDVTPW